MSQKNEDHSNLDNAYEHRDSCPAQDIATALAEELAQRVGVEFTSAEFTDSPAASWGLDSLDFVMLIDMVDRRFARSTKFPEVDLHAVSLLTLAAQMSNEAVDCDCRSLRK